MVDDLDPKATSEVPAEVSIETDPKDGLEDEVVEDEEVLDNVPTEEEEIKLDNIPDEEEEKKIYPYYVNYKDYGLILSEDDYVNANSYISVEEVTESIIDPDFKSIWLESMSAKAKVNFLIKITYLIDGFGRYQGKKTEERQLLEFPRNGSNIIPSIIKIAALELVTYELVKVEDPDNLNILEEKLGDLKRKYVDKYSSFYSSRRYEMPDSIVGLLSPLTTKLFKLG